MQLPEIGSNFSVKVDHMNHVEIIGFAAGILGSISLIPQLIKSWKTKSTKDLSLLWVTINLLGQALWISYGVVVYSLSLAVMSSINFSLGFLIFVAKVKYK